MSRLKNTKLRLNKQCHEYISWSELTKTTKLTHGSPERLAVEDFRRGRKNSELLVKVEREEEEDELFLLVDEVAGGHFRSRPAGLNGLKVG